MIFNQLKSSILLLVDACSILEPFKPITRTANIIDPRSRSEKAKIYWDDIQASWIKGGMFYWSMFPNDLGDMAIWHGLYATACAFKGDIPALTVALDGMKKLQNLGGLERIHRGVDTVGGTHAVDPSRKYYEDTGYIFIDDVSESTLIGHLFGLWAIQYCDIPGTLKFKAKMMSVHLAAQVSSDGYQLLNHDGTGAKFGNLQPGIATAPIRLAALACLLLMGDRTTEYEKLLKENLDTICHPETHLLWYNAAYAQILAYLILTILVNLDTNATRKKKFKDAMLLQWSKTKDQGNALYLYLLAMSTGFSEAAYFKQALMILDEFNLDATKGPLSKGPPRNNNMSPVGVTFQDWGWGSKKKRISLQPVPVWQREPVDFIWQRTPYSINPRSNYSYNGLDFCLAYYLGEHLRRI
jgi:hypothetical protein